MLEKKLNSQAYPQAPSYPEVNGRLGPLWSERNGIKPERVQYFAHLV